MAFGGVPTFNPPRMTRPPGQGEHLHQRPSTSFQELGKGWKVPAQELSTDQFRDAVGGVLCGYTGFVPNSRTHQGSAHLGGLARVGHRGHQAQRGHQGVTERMQADRALDLASRTLRTASPVVGYQGHLPKALDAFGTSFWRCARPMHANTGSACTSHSHLALVLCTCLARISAPGSHSGQTN